MRPKASRVGVAVLGAMALAVVALLVWQQRGVAALRQEVGVERERAVASALEAAELAGLAARQPSPGELARLRADREALRKLRAEIESLKVAAKSSAGRPAPTAAPVARAAEGGAEPTFAPGRMAKAEEWTNAGHATPAAAFETLLWAAAGGDLEVLARSLAIAAGDRAQVEAVWREVSAATRAEFGTPERLFAALTAKDVPIGSAQVFHQAVLKPGEWGAPAGTERAVVAARITDAEKKGKTIAFQLERADDGWRVLLPGAAIRQYRDALRGAAPASGGK